MSDFNWRDTHARYINLSHRTDREAHMQRELARVGLDKQIKMERFDAFRPSDYKGDPGRVEKMRQRTPGAIGCMMSQLAVCRTAEFGGVSAWVNEDDLIFSEDVIERLDYFEKFLNTRDWAIAWVGGTIEPKGTWHHPADMYRTEDPRIVRTLGAFSTHSWFLNIDHAQEVIDLIEAYMPQTIGIDHATIMVVQPKLPCFALLPGSVFQLDSKSDIGNGVTYFSGFLKSLGPHCFNSRKMTDYDPAPLLATLPHERTLP